MRSKLPWLLYLPISSQALPGQLSSRPLGCRRQLESMREAAPIAPGSPPA